MKTNIPSVFWLIGLLLGGITAATPNAHAQGGVPLWTNSYSGSSAGVAVDASGNVFVTGIVYGSGGGWTTIGYSSAGIPLWTNFYGPYINDVAAVAVDASGNVFVTGDDNDFVTIAYSGAGVPLWTNVYTGTDNNSFTFVSGIFVDGSGNVFVTGTSADSKSGDDWATIKYSNAGVPLWTNIFNGSRNGDDYAYKVVVDKSGNAFVTGESDDTDGGHYTTIKYSYAGVPLWTNRSPLISGSESIGHIALDSAGNVFMAGGFNGVDVTIAYSGAGIPLWTNRFGTNADDYWPAVDGIAVDTGGNVFVTGTLFDSKDNRAYGTVKYSSSVVPKKGGGAPLWTNLYNIDNYGGNPNARGVAVDSGGNVVVTGTGGTIAYSGAGVPLWTNHYIIDTANLSHPIAVDNSGNVIVTGYGATIKFSSSLPPPPRLDVQTLNHQLVLNWTNAGFTLQSAPDLTSTFTNIPSATSPFTNPLTAPQQFFRLIGN